MRFGPSRVRGSVRGPIRPRPRISRGWALAAVVLLSPCVRAQTPICDPALLAASDRPYSYRLRGDRCEGLYVEKVASTTLLVASLAETFADDEAGWDDTLHITWATAAERLNLRAYSLRRRLYYRMDTVRSGPAGLYEWPTDVLRTLGIRRHDVGLVAWADREVRGIRRQVYVPVRVNPPARPPARAPHRLVVVPGRELEEVYLSVVRLDGDGRPQRAVVDGEALRYGYYPAERPVVIPLPEVADRGLYAVEIGARLLGGGVASVEIWIDSPGGQSASDRVD